MTAWPATAGGGERRLRRRDVLGLGCALTLGACGGGGGGDGGGAAPAGSPPGTRGRFVAQASMAEARRAPGMARLPDGRVLVAGGSVPSGGGTIASTEVFDPRSGRWASGPRMAAGGSGIFMTPLADGRVLALQGSSVAETYDPATERWTAVPAGPQGFSADGSITLLADGSVLVLGFVRSMIFLPRSNSWAPVAGFDNRRDHAAVRLADGRVLVSGGWFTQSSQPTSSTLLFDPVAGTWQPGPRMRYARQQHFATRLPDGQVLLSHGVVDAASLAAASEIFDPQAGTFTPTAGPVLKFFSVTVGATATDIGGGRVLVLGGGTISGGTILDNAPQGLLDETNAEVFDPATRSWLRATAPGTGLVTPRRYHSALALADGGVLVVGGLGLAGAGTAAEIWQPG
jgi:hypothetical protein